MHIPLKFRYVIAAALALVLAVGVVPLVSPAEETGRAAVLLDIDGPIGPATSDYVVRNIEKAHEQHAPAIVLRIDTPGGLDTSMREVVQAILSAPMPVIGYVAPSGARAASAGTYILYATHVAAMAPATSLGAATPVQIGGLPLPGGETDTTEDGSAHPTMADKAVSDAVAYIRGLAQLRGRNVEWAEKAVTEAASLSTAEALKAGVIDLVADDIDALLAAADGHTVTIMGTEHTLHTAGLAVTPFAADWRTEFLEVITNPTIAYVLLLLGVYGLVFEFWNPGFTGPGVIGGICLLLALFALHLLPVNYAGLGLIALGIAFMVAETFVPAFGILGIGGVIAFVIGSVMLMETEVPGFQVSWGVIATVGGTSAVFFLTAMMMLARARRRPVVSGREELIGMSGKVLEWSGTAGRVRAHGEIWRATASTPLTPGQKVHITAIGGLVLVVQPISHDRED